MESLICTKAIETKNLQNWHYKQKKHVNDETIGLLQIVETLGKKIQKKLLTLEL